ENSEAHEAYLKGRAEQASYSAEGYQKAINYFEQAIEEDPNYALAYAVLAIAHHRLSTPLGVVPYREVATTVEEMAMKALEIDNSLGEAHAALGDVKRHYYWDWTGAEEEYKLAIALDPSSYQAHYGYAFLLSAMARHDEALAEVRTSQQLDPLNPETRTATAFHLRMARRSDEAIEQCRMALDMNPDYQLAHQRLANNYEDKGLYKEAAEARQNQWLLTGASEEEVAGLSDAAAMGAEDYSRWMLNYARERAQRGEYVSTFTFAMLHAQLGEKDQAFEWLEESYQERNAGLVILKVTPYFDPLRDDPRFTDLLRRMNLEP
ncbi:MAG: tetratricopeptide repeat protein, partial [Acidobacteria bacterium]|nr:tetratricopeptide repeat protein [Acidobacteriota bacterium]